MSKLGRKRIIGQKEGWACEFTLTLEEIHAEANKLHLKAAREAASSDHGPMKDGPMKLYVVDQETGDLIEANVVHKTPTRLYLDKALARSAANPIFEPRDDGAKSHLNRVYLEVKMFTLPADACRAEIKRLTDVCCDLDRQRDRANELLLKVGAQLGGRR